MSDYNDMLRRVDETPELQPYRDTITCDWPNMAEHIEWVCAAPIAEIVDWAQAVEEANV